jgi:hypothetical protein
MIKKSSDREGGSDAEEESCETGCEKGEICKEESYQESKGG